MKKIIFVVFIFVLGMFGLGAVNTVFSYTNEMDFCTSCHSMKINLEEYKETVHYKSASGVRATCADCHVPKAFFPKLKAKIMAAKDVYHEIVGTVDTKEKYEAHRWDMASRVWAKMKANDSRECRSCHGTGRLALQKGKVCGSCYPHGSGKCQNCRGLGGFDASGKPAPKPTDE